MYLTKPGLQEMNEAACEYGSDFAAAYSHYESAYSQDIDAREALKRAHVARGFDPGVIQRMRLDT